MEEHHDLPDRIPLCVPYARRSEASAAGARFDREEKAWFCNPAAITSAGLQQFLPFRFRYDRPGPYIRPWMVPQPLWGINLRAMLEPEDWKHIRKAAYERSGYRCRVCGGKGPQWPVEADEGWRYDDGERVQVLMGVIALCPDCHAVRHWGKSLTEGREDQAATWMAQINGWTIEKVRQCADDAMEQWHRRSQYDDWRCDISWALSRYGVKPRPDGFERGRQTNQDFVDSAANAWSVSYDSEKDRYIHHLFRET